jgi:hypothetical protein
MTKIQAALTGSGLLALAWFAYAVNAGSCGTIALLLGFGCLGLAYVKHQYHERAPQQVLDQYTSRLSSQHRSQDQPAMSSEDSHRMFVPPALDE